MKSSHGCPRNCRARTIRYPNSRMITVAVNDRPIDVAAIVEHGRVLLPMRATFAALGASVVYDPRGRVIVARSAAHALQLRIGSTTADVDGRMVTLDVPARVVAATTYVPLRFVAQAMGAVVGYDARSNLVNIHAAPIVSMGSTPAPDSDVNPAPLPSVAPGLPDGPAFGPYDYRFYANGPASYYPGDWMHFTLIAPPGGSAQVQLCGMGYQYALWNGGSGTVYQANIQAPSGYWIPTCTVTAVYTAWNGQQYYVPIPVIVGIYTDPRHLPTPAPSSRPIPHPGGPRRTPPPAAPASLATPVPTPHAAPTPAPPPRPERTPHPVPHPRETP